MAHRKRSSGHLFAHLAAAQHVNVQVVHRLRAVLSAVVHQAEAVLGKSRGVRSADQDVALAGRHVMQQGQCRTGRFADESLQQLRGREIGGSLLCHDDPGRRFAVAGQPGLRPDSGRPKQNISLRFKDNFSSRRTKICSTK